MNLVCRRRPVRLVSGLTGLLVVIGAGAGCGPSGTSDSAESDRSAIASSPPTSSSAVLPQTFAELTARPCTALDGADTQRFDVTVAGQEMPGAPNGCFWMTSDFGIGFHPHPSSDRTSPLPPFPGATPITVEGRRAVQIPESRPEGCNLEVAIAPDQSFSLGITVPAATADIPRDTCAFSNDVATAILAHLR